MNNAIFITFDDKFFKYAKICLKSIEKNYPTHPTILAYYDGRSKDVIKFLNTISNLRIMPFNFDFLNLEGINFGKVNSKKVYFRYILWTNMLDEYNTIVHLDIDTVILKPFDKLFKKKTFFAISDFTPFGYTLFDERRYEDPELRKLLDEDNFTMPAKRIEMMNAGVFVIQKKYRKRKHFDKLLELTKRYNRFTTFADQAAISMWCYLNKISFSNTIEYNFQYCFLANQYIFYNVLLKRKTTLDDVCIMHFSWWKPNSVFYKSQLANAKMLVEVEQMFLVD